jgi:hypothetical protein
MKFCVRAEPVKADWKAFDLIQLFENAFRRGQRERTPSTFF